MQRIRATSAVLLLLSAMLAVGSLGAWVRCVAAWQVAGGGVSADKAKPASPEETRDELLGWLDEYLLRQVLFEKEDLLTLRSKIEKMSTPELARWLEETRQIRQELDSPEWRATEDWMREFLRVQAIYSDEEVAEFRAKAAKMSPGELHELLETIRQKHRSLRGTHQASEQRRSAQLSSRNAFLKQQEQARKSAARRTARSSNPLFGNTQASAHRRAQTPTRYSRPLITSNEVARQAVRRSIWGGRGGWGW